MTSNPKVSVHFGMAKTGSTFLQQVIFRECPDLIYLGKDSSNESLNQLGANITRQSSAHFDFAAARSSFQEAFRPPGKLPVLLSDEDLSRYLFLDPELMAARLNGLLGSFVPIYIIRRPLDWVQSMYFFRLMTFRADALLGPEHWLQTHMSDRGLGSETADLHVGRVAASYRRLCGSGAIHVLCYEELKQDPYAYLAKLANLIGLDTEKVLSLADAAPANKRRDKARISQSQAEFLWGCKTLLVGDQAGFVRHIETALADLPPGGVARRAHEMASTCLSQRDMTLESVSQLLHLILRATDTLPGTPAQLNLSEDWRRKLRNMCKRQVEIEDSIPAALCSAFGYFDI